MSELDSMVRGQVAAGAVPGAVALIARGSDVDVATAGSFDLEGSRPMARDTIFRIASISKPMLAAAVLTLADEGRLALTDPISRWLPELANPSVVREPKSAPDDVVPADREITVEDVLSSRAGWGFPDDFSLPAVGLLLSELHQGSAFTQTVLDADAWLTTLGQIPLLAQPGQRWLYNTCSDLQGILIARVSGQTLPNFLVERIFGPLGMADTGFQVPADKLDRFPSLYSSEDAQVKLIDPPTGPWSRPPVFASGAGGLVSTLDDWLSFGRMLLAGGASGAQRVLSQESTRRMTTNCLTLAQRQAGALFLEGQGWGFGGSVDVNRNDPWTVPGRYGWVGGTGTSAHVNPSNGTVAILMTQVAMNNPTPPELMRSFWSLAAE